MLKLDEFIDDKPWADEDLAVRSDLPCKIDGVRIVPLVRRSDDRGDLSELLTLRDGGEDPIVHVYLVRAAPKSVRAWVYHKRQWDRLAYTEGRFRVVLYDLRPESPSHGILEVFEVGEANNVLLNIPPFVAHGVQNYGDETSSFINMPTRIYDPANPDKSRIPATHPGVPYAFPD